MMKKSTLKLVVFFLAFALIAVIPYFEEATPRWVGDTLQLFMVMTILTALETNTLDVILSEGTSDLIPRCIKTVIGVVMLLGLVSILKQSGWFSTGYFNDAIISQLPITAVDVCVLVIIGTSLYWAGGLMYQTMIKATVSIGNICCYVLRKMGLVELEDDEEGDMKIEKTIHEARELVGEFRRDLGIVVGESISKEQAEVYQSLLKSLDALDECLMLEEGNETVDISNQGGNAVE